ncbi:MAG: hypothetical protein LBF44_01550 [Holosporaceae bacterium]|nr:hypothetical protein [Holosporaceae bacterium]
MKNGINIKDNSIIPKKVSSIAVTEMNTHMLIKKKINAKPIIMERSYYYFLQNSICVKV